MQAYPVRSPSLFGCLLCLHRLFTRHAHRQIQSARPVQMVPTLSRCLSRGRRGHRAHPVVRLGSSGPGDSRQDRECRPLAALHPFFPTQQAHEGPLGDVGHDLHHWLCGVHRDCQSLFEST